MVQQTTAPIRKVTTGAVSGAILTLGFFAYSFFTKRAVNPNVETALSVIVSFVAAYFTPPAVGDTLITKSE